MLALLQQQGVDNLSCCLACIMKILSLPTLPPCQCSEATKIIMQRLIDLEEAAQGIWYRAFLRLERPCATVVLSCITPNYLKTGHQVISVTRSLHALLAEQS